MMNQLNELITIATVNKEFRHTLLTNPNLALAGGYQGKKLELSDKDKKILFSANAKGTGVVGWDSGHQLAFDVFVRHKLPPELDREAPYLGY